MPCKIILTIAGDTMLPHLMDHSLPTFKLFAARWGYEVAVEKPPIDGGEHRLAARWFKVEAIQRQLERVGPGGLVLYADADVMFVRPYDEDVADHLGPDDFQGFALEYLPACKRVNPGTGVWVIRNTPMAQAFLRRMQWIGRPDRGPWADQGAAMRALGWHIGDPDTYRGAKPGRGNEFWDGTAVLPPAWNHLYCPDPLPPQLVGMAQVPEDQRITVHFAGMDFDERYEAMAAMSDSLRRRGLLSVS